MNFGPTRGHPLFIFDHFLKNFGLLLIAFIIALFKGPERIFENIFVLFFILISPVERCIKYFSTYYSIDNYKMTVQSGIFTKKKLEIPIEAITTVDFAQNIVHQLFGVYKLKIDNSSQTNDFAKEAEISITLGKDKAFLVKELLLSKDKNAVESSLEPASYNNESHNIILKSRIKDFIILGLLQAKLAFILSFSPIAYGVFSFIASRITSEYDIKKFFDDPQSTSMPIPNLIIILFSVYLIGLISSTFLTVVKYYNFRITDSGNSLHIEFGLFTKKTYTLMKEKISGIAVKQSFWMKILGYATTEVFVIGYGDLSEGKNEELAMLYPLLKLNTLQDTLHKILPEISLTGNYKKPKKKALRYFFLCPRFILTVCFVVIALFFKSWILISFTVCFLLLAFISVIFEYQNTGLFANSNTVSFSGGGFKKQILYIKTEKIESVSEHSSIWKRKKNITTVSLGFLAPLRVSSARVKNVAFEDFKDVFLVINY